MTTVHFTDPRPSVPFSCLHYLLQHQATRIPEAPAILAPGRAPLTYRGLYQHVEKAGRALRATGIGRSDRVAVVLPNGPEMAVAILTVAANATCAPVNPAYGVEELGRYFEDLRPRTLITKCGIDSPARHVALSRGIRVVELSIACDAEAGRFTLTGDHGCPPSDEQVNPSDVALLLLTSGTTSRPKIVPLTHAKICASAYAHREALTLRESDRCLNVLPLFHGHGLVATVMASLSAGASVVCTTGLDANDFSTWLKACEPTWYSAVPTMHQAILAQARFNRERAAACRLRFVRSSSAPLPPGVFAELEQAFEAPVIEWYGMAEVAASPIACNPLPPRERKPGSVGIPVGLDVAIMDEAGALLLRGQTGQVVVRGTSVIDGYDSNPMATEAAFAGDWFKTGDLGFFDDDGYLFLSGRIREMINRGGEKIAPREVDEVLLEHPAVAEAVTFAVPHAKLGEDVAAAVVLRPGGVATPKDIRRFAIGRIADFKVPRQVLVVGEIPKGPTGKVQRIGLAAKLGLATTASLLPAFVAPRIPLENALAKRWAELLQVEQIGVHDDFFASGGDSLLATRVLSHIFEITQVKLEVSRFFASPTVAEVAHHLERLGHADQVPQAPSVIARAPREVGVASASIAQERLWKSQHALPDMPFFNILYALRLTSPCDLTVLQQSMNEIVRRHEILRTTFGVIADRHVQVIAPQLTVPLPLDDLHELPKSKRETVGHHLVQKELLHSFDFTHGPLVRMRLLRLAEREHLLLITMHQIIVDGWSLGVFGYELATIYEALAAGRAPQLPPLPIQYADFACWQRQWQSYPDVVEQLAYWREQLHDPLPTIRLATARPRQRINRLRTARREVALPANLLDTAKRFSHGEGGTLFMVLVATLKILLHRYLGQDDLCVATNVANRNRPGVEGLIGPLANTLILRTNLGGDPSCREAMRRVRVTTLAAFAHQDLPFEVLTETLERERALKPVDVSRVMILFHNASLRPIASSGQALAFEEADPSMILPLVTATTFDVILALRESTYGLVGCCIYKTHLLSVKTIDRLLRDFQKVLEHMITQPERPISAIRVSLNDKA